MTPDPGHTVQVLRDGNTVSARIRGPLNGETAPLCWERLSAALVTECEMLALDLGAVEYVDSDGIRWLQRAHAELVTRRIRIRLAVREGSRVERTLRLLKLDEQFQIERYPTEDCQGALSSAA